MSPDEAYKQDAKGTTLDTSILALCLAPRDTADLVRALGAEGSLARLDLVYRRVAYLCWSQALAYRVGEPRALHPPTVLETRCARVLGAERPTVEALLAALSTTPQTLSQVSRAARVHDDTARRVLPRLAALGLATHSRGATHSRAAHLWALAPLSLRRCEHPKQGDKQGDEHG